MSVIAWDGAVLAADRQGICGERKFVSPKMIVRGDRAAAWVGPNDFGNHMAEWFFGCARAADFPEFQRTNEFATLVAWDGERLVVFQQSPIPAPVLGLQAWGSGRDFAATAMHLGRDAVRAVKITNELCASCGFGADQFNTLDRSSGSA